MVRGTTAQFKFKLPYTKADVLLAEFKIWQSENKGLNQDFPLPIIKNYTKEISADGEVVTSNPWMWIDDYTLLVRLGQQETLTFSDKYKARAIMRVRTIDGLVFASDERMVLVYPGGDTPLGNDIIIPESDSWIILDGSTINKVGEVE